MIKTIITLLFVFITSQVPAIGQEFSLGGGFSYGTNIKNPGINFRGDITFYNKWSITPHFNVFFNKKDNLITSKWNAFNIDGHYFLELDRTWTIYPLIGINFATVAEKANEITFSNSDVGLNLGFGSNIKFEGRLTGFGEIKYVIGNADQAVITAGILYQLTN